MKKEEVLEHIIVLEVYTLLTILAFHKLFILGIDKYIIGDFGDPWQSMWNIVIVKENIVRLKSPFYTDQIFYPHGTSLIFHTLSLVNALIAFPLTFFLNIVTIYNLLILSTFILSGYFMYLLVRYLTKNNLISLTTGFAYAFSPYHISKAIGYLNLSSIQWIPLFFLFFIRIFEEKNKKKKLKFSILAALSILMIVLSSDQLFFFIIPLIIVHIIYRLFVSPGNRISLFYYTFLFLLIFLIFSSPLIILFIKEYTIRKDELSTRSECERHFITASIVDYFYLRDLVFYFHHRLKIFIINLHMYIGLLIQLFQ
jgi:hypothetical protein